MGRGLKWLDSVSLVEFRSRLALLLAPRAAALDLAIFRITVALVVAGSSSVAAADRWAALPAGARSAPWGVGWLVPHLPLDVGTVTLARGVLWAACITGGLGIFSRASFALVSVAGLYVLLVPQLGGAVFHDHHLLWFSILLAASPCGDALSFDAWRARRQGRPRPASGRAHGAAVRITWLLIGLIFFFPSVHKLAESGLAWITSDNLRNQLWWKWAQDPSTQPTLRIDQYPQLMRVAAGLTVLFELSFLPLVVFDRTRAIAVIGALCFHAATDYFMGIDFSVLWLCYTVFVPWSALVDRVPKQRTGPASDLEPRRDAGVPSDRASLWPLAGVGAALLLGVSTAGALGVTQGYPFACYPTFQWIADDHMPALAVAIDRQDGALVQLEADLYRGPGPRGWAMQWRLVGAYDEVSAARIDAWWDDLVRQGALEGALHEAAALHFYRVELSVDPARRGEELERTEIYVRPP